MVKTGDGLFLIVGEFPNDECDANTVSEDRIEIGELKKTTIVDTGHSNFVKTLKFGNGNIFEEPGGEIRTEDAEIFAGFDGEGAKTFFVAGGNIEDFVEISIGRFEKFFEAAGGNRIG